MQDLQRSEESKIHYIALLVIGPGKKIFTGNRKHWSYCFYHNYIREKCDIFRIKQYLKFEYVGTNITRYNE